MADDLNIALNFNISSFENEITKLPRDFIDARVPNAYIIIFS
jgi:hypothetical protein